MIPSEWQDPQFLQELMEDEQNQLERTWARAQGRWANLQWEPSDVTPMEEEFETKHGELVEHPMLEQLADWELALLRRYWLEQLQDRPSQTPANPVSVEGLTQQQVQQLEEFLEQALFLIRQLELAQEDKDYLR